MCIYFIYEEGNKSAFAIGASDDVAARILVLQIGNPRRLKIYKTIESDHDFSLQSGLHDIFVDKRCQAEWFNIDVHMVDYICGMVESCAENGENIWSALFHINKGIGMATSGMDSHAVYSKIGSPHDDGYDVAVKVWDEGDDEDVSPTNPYPHPRKNKRGVKVFYKGMRERLNTSKLVKSLKALGS